MAELYSPELYSAAQSIVVLFLPAESGGLTAGTFRGCFRNPLEARQEVDQFQEEHGYGERKGEYQRAKEGLSVGERERSVCAYALGCGRQFAKCQFLYVSGQLCRSCLGRFAASHVENLCTATAQDGACTTPLCTWENEGKLPECVCIAFFTVQLKP